MVPMVRGGLSKFLGGEEGSSFSLVVSIWPCILCPSPLDVREGLTAGTRVFLPISIV